MYLKPSPLSPSGPAQATDAAPRRIAIVANPGSGRRDPGLFDQICDALDRHGAQASLHVVKDGRSLTDVAREALEDDIDILAVGGGDGSIAGVTSVLFERQQLNQVWKLRRVLNGLANDGSGAAAGLELLIDRLKTFNNNEEFLVEIAKGPSMGD